MYWKLIGIFIRHPVSYSYTCWVWSRHKFRSAI